MTINGWPHLFRIILKGFLVLLALYTAILVGWIVWETYPRIFHDNIRMTWRGK
jgi:hypothetical protein